jgi:hypothetical protein
MKIFALWCLSLLSLAMMLFSLAASYIAALSFLLLTIYSNPFLKAKLKRYIHKPFLFNQTMGWLISIALIVVGMTNFEGGMEAKRAAERESEIVKLIDRYKKERGIILEKIRYSIAAKKYFLAQRDLKPLLANVRGDVELKELLKMAFIGEMQQKSENGTFYLLTPADFEEFSRLVESDEMINEVKAVYSPLAVREINRLMTSSDLTRAAVFLDKSKKIVPGFDNDRKMSGALSQAQIKDSSKGTSDSNILMPKKEFWADRGQVTVDVYRHACVHAFLDRKEIIESLSVGRSASPEGKIASNLGISAVGNTKVWWDERELKCYGSFTISGTVNGSDYRINKQGAVYGFYPIKSDSYAGYISLF